MSVSGGEDGSVRGIGGARGVSEQEWQRERPKVTAAEAEEVVSEGVSKSVSVSESVCGNGSERAAAVAGVSARAATAASAVAAG